MKDSNGNNENVNNLFPNIAKVIKNDEKKCIMKALNCDEKYINGEASDFEWFDEWERILPLAKGHKEIEKYKEELSALGAQMPNTEYSKKRSVERWRQINSRNFLGIFEERREITGDEKYSKPIAPSPDCLQIKLNNYVTNNINDCDSIKKLTAKIYQDVKSSRILYVTLKTDLPSDECLRPNPYASEAYYSQYRSGEKLNSKALSEMYAQILIESIILMKNDINISLNLNSHGLLKYLKDRRIFEGEAQIPLTSESDTDKLIKLLNDVYPNIKLRPLIDTSTTTFTEQQLAELFSKYPQSAFTVK